MNHIDALKLEQHAERSLPPGEAAAVQAHLDQCGRCNAEYSAMTHMMGLLTELPRFAPSPAFANAVMARVQVAPEESAALALFRKVIPRTRRGLVLVATASMAPVIPILVLVLWLITQPLVTPAGLWQWTIAQAQTFTQTGTAWLLDQAMTSGFLALADRYLNSALTMPTSTLGGLLTFFGIAIPLSAWGLVHLTRTPVGKEHHAV